MSGEIAMAGGGRTFEAVDTRRTRKNQTVRRTQPRWRAALRVFGRVLLWLLVAAGAVLLGASLWIRRTFGPVSIDQMLMSLPGAGGAETTQAEAGYVSSFIGQALVIPLASVLGLFLLCWVCKRLWNARIAGRKDVVLTDEPHRRHFSRLRVDKWLPGLSALIVFVAGVALFSQTVGVAQYLRSATTSLTMMDYYVAPETHDDSTLIFGTSEPDGEPKNLITIYLESGDDAFADAEVFGENLLAPLQEATTGWASIPALRAYEGGGWTMAGLVGTQCGIPLRGPGIGENDINSNEIGAEYEEYLPGATCLGDVLDSAGYTNVYLGGADAEFASKGSFLYSHGYSEVKDLSYWIEQGEVELSTWGLSDRALMERAKEEVTRLHEADEPFSLTMLTLDFHEPAQRSEYCPPQMEIESSSVLICSMEYVAGFVDYLEENGYLGDTVVVVMADHPKMIAVGGTYSAELGGVPFHERLLFNRIWAPGGEVHLARGDIDQLSVYPTILDLLGIGGEDGRAGVGVSALAQSLGGAAIDLPDEQYLELLQSRSDDLYRRLWNIDDGALVIADAK